jgi:hypothetical protein
MNHIELIIGLLAMAGVGQNPMYYFVPASIDPSVSIAEPVPASSNMTVPFYSQAPLGNWEPPWSDACEEASLLIAANYYYSYRWTAPEFADRILNLIEWEKEHLGVYIDTSTVQNAIILNDYLHLNVVFLENPSFYQVKKILSEGHLILMPVAGKELGNSNYINGGPTYHVLLLKGYSGNKVITHDVGTSVGADYAYEWNTVANANHDLADPIDSGAKIMIEIIPPTGGF